MVARIDWLTLRFAERVLDEQLLHDEDGVIDEHASRGPDREALRAWSWHSTTLAVQEGAITDVRSTDKPVGRIFAMHGGLHVILPGDYWRRHHEPEGLRQLIEGIREGAINGWTPTHLTMARIDYAHETSWNDIETLKAHHLGTAGMEQTVLAHLGRIAALVAPRMQILHPKSSVGQTVTSSPDGITVYVGYLPAANMRSKDALVRVYSRFADRTVRVEVELKKVAGDSLAEQWQHARQTATAVLLYPTEDRPTPTEGLPGRTDTGILEMIDRAVGCYLSASQRTRTQPTPMQLDALEVACAQIIGEERARARLARALKKRGIDDPR